MSSRGLSFGVTARGRKGIVFFWIALFIMSIALQYAQLSRPTTALAADGLLADTVQGFEIDGDLRSGNASTNPGDVPDALIHNPPMADGDDWLQGPGNNGVASAGGTNTPTTFLFEDAVDPGDDSAYGGGNKEDDTRDWVYVNSAGPNPKTDFRHIMAHARMNNAGTSAFAYLGAERIVNNGTMVVDFELNKKPFKQYAVGPLKPDRSNGDLLISLEYSNGGSNPIVTLYTITNVQNFANGQTNDFTKVSDQATIDAVRSATNFVDLSPSGFGYTIPSFDFAEASIDLSALGIETGCPGFSSGHIRSRTGGDPQSSQLKDAAPAFPIDLNTCGKVTIIKNAIPNDAQDFDFTTTGGAPLADFSLDNDGNDDNALSKTKTFEQVPPGGYSVTEGTVDGWKLTDIECDDGNSTGDTGTRKATINVGNNEHVTCTFTNTKLGKIIVEKQTEPDGSAGTFTFTGDAAGDLEDGEQIVVDDLLPGTYTSTEADPTPPFDLSAITCNDDDSEGDLGTRTATFHLQAGETVKCTFTNTKRGSITIIKDAVPNDPQNFTYTGLGGFVLDDDSDPTLSNTHTSSNLAPGSYTVTESDVTGWELTNLVCNDGDGGTTVSIANRQAVIDLDPGQSITCTYTNTKAGRIIVVKQTDPDGDPQVFDFTASYDADGFSLSDGQSNNSGDLKPGVYAVAEEATPGWDLTSATCDDGSVPAAIGLSAGETVTCTFNNQKDSTIVVVKQTDPDGDPTSFAFTASYDADGFSLSDGQSNNSGDLDPGTYSVAEQVPAGWDLTSATCDDGSDPASIGLSAGETVTCVFTNQKDSKIIVVKQTDPDGDPTSFEFDPSYGSNFFLSDGQSNDSGDLNPGTYSVAEIVPAGWSLTSATCDDGSSPNSIGLAAGEVVTCTFNNTKLGTIIVEKQTSPDGASGDFVFTGDAADTISDGEQIVVNDLMPGTYDSTEADPGPNFDLQAIDCDDANSEGDTGTRTATFHLEAGETVKCTFTNVQRGTITIIKDASPEDPQDFAFTTEGLSNFNLDDDGDDGNTLSNMKTFINLLAGSYSVTESDVAGWDLTAIDCETGGGSSFEIDGATANLTLTSGGSITCVFHNAKPSIEIVKTAGDAADGEEFVTVPGPVTYHYLVTNTGPVELHDIVVTDDNGTPGDPSDDFTADCPETSLAPAGEDGDSMECTATVQVTENRTNVGTVEGTSDGDTTVTDDDDAVVRIPGIEIDKSADDHLVEQNQTVSYTINVVVDNGPVLNAVVTDDLPDGQTYVAGSSEVDGSPSEPTVSNGGKTLTWDLGTLNDGDPAATITYDVTIDSDASTDPQTNTAELCVFLQEGEGQQPLCDDDDETVTPELPSIEIIKTAGDAANGEVFTTEPGLVTYHYLVTNTGPLPLHDVTVTDDNGTPGDTSDDFVVDCPETELAAAGQEGDSMECSATVSIDEPDVTVTNVAVAEGTSPEGNEVEDDDDAVVETLIHGLVIAKSNNAPLETLELPDGTTADLPTADEGSTVTFTLDYTFTGDPVTNGIITDEIPVGLTYVADSASDSDTGEFVFVGYDAATRTLTWTAEDVTESGTITYQAKVDTGASELPQPLENIATIDSDQTEPDDDTSDVFVPVIPKAETAPPTDVLVSPEGPSAPGSSMLLVLAVLGGIVLAIGFVTPVPAVVRRRNRR